MRLIAGLGNPGPDYDKTRHNAGFLAIDRLVARAHASGEKAKFHGLCWDVTLAGEKCLLLKPMTFMNKSGLALGEAATFFKIDPQDILVLVDDWSLPVGRIRLRGEGSPGGHNGLADIQRALGGANYRRLRIGIDTPYPGSSQIDYVLSRFSTDQWPKLDLALDAACDCVESWIQHGLAKTMSRFNAAE